MPAFLLDFTIIDLFIIFSFIDRYAQNCGSFPVILFSSSSSSYFISVSLDFNSLLFSASRRETRFLPNTRSMKKVWSCFLFIPTDFNLDLQFFLKWLKHLRPVSFVTVSPKALCRAFSPSVIYPRPFLANSGQLAQTAHAIFL